MSQRQTIILRVVISIVTMAVFLYLVINATAGCRSSCLRPAPGSIYI
jgi:hypothetical protein